MRNPIKDTDYLAISARIKAMETTLLTRERMEQVLEAKTDDEALKLLQESGYPQLRGTDPTSLDAALSAAQGRELRRSDRQRPRPQVYRCIQAEIRLPQYQGFAESRRRGRRP